MLDRIGHYHSQDVESKVLRIITKTTLVVMLLISSEADLGLLQHPRWSALW